MKKSFGLILTSVLLCSCSGTLTENEKHELFTNNLTCDNYETFFNVEHNSSFRKTIITPRFNKHFNYENVAFSYKTESYAYTVKIDETGKGEEKDTDKSYTSALKHDLVSVTGIVSFKDDYTSFQRIETMNRDPLHKEQLSVVYSFSGNTKYALSYRTDLNFKRTADTDAFYLIESVKIRFTATVNNSQKNFELEAHPDFFGDATIPVEGEFSGTLSNVSFQYVKGYYLAY